MLFVNLMDVNFKKIDVVTDIVRVLALFAFKNKTINHIH